VERGSERRRRGKGKKKESKELKEKKRIKVDTLHWSCFFLRC
jgi:hypothetical protein